MVRINASIQTVFLLILTVCVSVISLWAQESPAPSPAVNKARLRTVVIGSSVAYAGAMTALSSVWYSQYDQTSFHFFNDAGEWQQMDKVGHFYSAFQLSAISSRMFQWTGLPVRKSDKIGALVSFGMMASIEVLDGFSSGYGASATDLLADAVGAGFYLGQELVWKEIRIHPKFSFHRTDYAALRPETLGSTSNEEIIKDYNGQTYWLSADMDKFIRFPKWLNIAVGYGAEQMIYANDSENIAAGLNPYRQYYLSLDFDLTAYRSKSKWLNTLIYIVNMIKLPTPTIEFSNHKFHGYIFYF